MRSLFGVGLGVALALATIGATFAATADGKSPSSAAPLANTASVSIMGSSAGSFAYYSFDYPLPGAVGTLTLDFNPNDPSTANAVGVQLWQDGVSIATTNGVGATPGTSTLAFSSATAGPVLVQLYNYDPSTDVAFQLSLSGVPAAMAAPGTSSAASGPTTSVATTGTVAAGTASDPISLKTSSSTTLTGSPAGAYKYYTLLYPGDSSTQTITLDFSPNGPDVASSLFVNVYQDGTLLSSTPGTSDATPGQIQATFSSTIAGPVLVQVGNFSPSMTTVGYTISH